MRAQAASPELMPELRIAAYQVALERMNFSVGFIDGDLGARTQRALRALQESRGLPVTGLLDDETQALIGEPGDPYFNYTVTPEDMALINPPSPLWAERSKAKFLGYRDAWDMLGEKFHCTKLYVRQLNPDVQMVEAGTVVIGTKVFPAAKLPHAAKVRVVLGETLIQALDANGRIIANFPCSIAADKAKRPSGVLRVISMAIDPDYTFNPEVLKEIAEREGLTKKMRIPPGPRNPVGVVWMGLNLPGYGMHGTPDPEDISRTMSHGCFRLCNWNAKKLVQMVNIGTPVEIVP
jgi:lipoprotein-anchoring transpeptidase ErfK/SrfK